MGCCLRKRSEPDAPNFDDPDQAANPAKANRCWDAVPGGTVCSVEGAMQPTPPCDAPTGSPHPDALMDRLRSRLKEEGVELSDLVGLNDDELNENLRELGFDKALQRTKLKKKIK
eukprot:gene129-7182_t